MHPARLKKIDTSVGPSVARFTVLSLTKLQLQVYDGGGTKAVPLVRKAAYAQKYLDEDAKGKYALPCRVHCVHVSHHM
jgi:hypothetical protein